MRVFGLYTSKEVDTIRVMSKHIGYVEAQDKYEKEIKEIMDFNSKIIDSQCQEIGVLRKDLKELNKNILKVSSELKNKELENNVLRFILAAETDKEIKRLEAIAKRTRKPRIKKKCESRIIDYKMRKISYEGNTERIKA